MSKIKVLEVNNIDLLGRRFNGYDILEAFNKTEKFNIKQIVNTKLSTNENVVKLFEDNYHSYIEWLLYYEQNKKLNVHSQLSITYDSLINHKEFKNSDIVHYHLIDNIRLPLYSLGDLTSQKPSVISIHDPWLLTGGCVYPFKCQKWRNDCKKCETIQKFFTYSKDNSHILWNQKKNIFKSIDVDIIVHSNYTKELVQNSPITKHIKNVHYIPFGIDLNKFNEFSRKEARNRLGISNDHIVLFFRAQSDSKGTNFKGTNKIIEALKDSNFDIPITVLTCDQVNTIEVLKEKFNVIELGKVQNDEIMVDAFNACDIFLMPSSAETFGLMAIEAMACARPVVIFDNSALPAVTFAPECGYLVEDNNSTELRKAIDYLANNEKERTRRGKLGRKLAEENYNLEEYNQKISDLYENVYNRKTKNNNIKKYKVDYKNSKSQLLIRKLNNISRTFGLNLFCEHINDDVDIDKDIDYSIYNNQMIIKEFNVQIYKKCNSKKHTISNNEKIIKFKKIIYFIKNNRKHLINKFLKRSDNNV